MKTLVFDKENEELAVIVQSSDQANELVVKYSDRIDLKAVPMDVVSIAWEMRDLVRSLLDDKDVPQVRARLRRLVDGTKSR